MPRTRLDTRPLVKSTTKSSTRFENSKLEQQLQSGGIPLIEEKRIVAEISTLKKTKKQLETLNQPGAIDAEKQKLDEIKPLIKTYDEQIAKLDVQLTEAKTTMTKHEQELSATRDSLNDLFTQKKDLSAKLNAAKDAKNQFYKEFKAAQDAWYAYEREQYRLREEQRKLEQKQQRDAKMLAQAEYELEAAEVPAYGEELALCAAIVKVLKNLTGEKDETPAPAPATPAGRQVDEKDSMPKGGSLLVSKRDKDDDFIVLGNKKSKKQSKKQAQVELNKPVKLDIEMIDQFGRLKIDMPRTFAEIPNTIAALDAKSKEFLKNQATQTKANKEAALAKLNKIKEQLAAQDTEGFQTAE
ncbi:hypothetical protein EDD86DRAFT_208418 [Gorgonomyces haynaldii]|nr:hypothetical protein EDD86DRAFT_208418 [Gorgonomyces haynaldii]